MNKRKIFIVFLLFIALFILININNKTYATELDKIENYTITIDPNMNDGSLDITYEIKWKVLDSVTEGPLTWVKIGTPNSHFSNPTALTPNIKNISEGGDSYVRIDFNKAYNEGDIITFKYSIHQEHMYKIKSSKCKYEFTPAWFTDIKIDKITIKWNKDQVKKADNNSEEGNYYIWSKTNLDKGEKIKAKIEYKKNAFSYLDENKQASSDLGKTFSIILGFVIIIIIIIIFSSFGGGGGYYRHRGFYIGPTFYTHHHHGGGCAHSSCACASRCACACACAGSGRAGCSKKDFYGTNLKTKKIKEALK